MRLRVEEWLAAQGEAGHFFVEGAAALEPATASEVLVSEKPGDCIGSYKLLEQTGEGGCGVVSETEPEQPVRRCVAFKVIRLGMDTRSAMARFGAEPQALALIGHPNIAKVLDAGATEAGRPCAVMELGQIPNGNKPNTISGAMTASIAWRQSAVRVSAAARTNPR